MASFPLVLTLGFTAWTFCHELYLFNLVSVFAFSAQSSFSSLSKYIAESWFLSNEKLSTVYFSEGAVSQEMENKNMMRDWCIWYDSYQKLSVF